MPYKATVVFVEPDPNYPNISVSTIVFSNGEKDVTDVERGFNAEQLVKYCREKVAKLDADEAQETGMADLMTNPPIGDVDLSLPEPTEEEVKAKEEAQALQKLKDEKHRVELLTFQSDDPDFIKAKQEYLEKKDAGAESADPITP